MSNKYVKFHFKKIWAVARNGKKILGDTFLPHTVEATKLDTMGCTINKVLLRTG